MLYLVVDMKSMSDGTFREKFKPCSPFSVLHKWLTLVYLLVCQFQNTTKIAGELPSKM